jgi:antitoxin (DNA-binding transcriptional repressor) of toxin-antitoxin stability system
VAFGYWLEKVADGEDVVVTRRGKPMIRLTAAAPRATPVPGTVAITPLLPSAAAGGPS